MHKNSKLYFSSLRPIELILGEDYLVMMWGSGLKFCRFIKPTPKGYNFLDLDTSKCILKRHIYPATKIGPNMFFVHENMIIKHNISKIV